MHKDVVIIAILCITILELTAILKGLDGQLLALAFLGIGAALTSLVKLARKGHNTTNKASSDISQRKNGKGGEGRG